MTSKSPKPKGGKHRVCVFCEQDDICQNTYGKLLTRAGVTAHYFCMLFSSGLSQNGKSEKQGILGFLQSDILKEVKRGSRLKCSYCRRNGATIGCVIKNCKKMFHLGCGRANGTMHQFFGTFSSFCPGHRVKQDVPSNDDPDIVCSICRSSLTASPSNDTIRAPCCSKDWYHRDCIQRYATSAGLYYFTCPLCTNKNEFQGEMLTMGIYIPDQDASWEKEPHAFQELLERYCQCDAPVCKCVEGRKYDKEGSKWEIILCDFCGSHGSHVACSHLGKLGKHDICHDCKEVDEKTRERDYFVRSSRRKKKSLELLQLELFSSPEQSKGASPYPGPSDAMQKVGLPNQPARSSTRGKNKSTVKKGKRLASPEVENRPDLKKQKSGKRSATVTYAMVKRRRTGQDTLSSTSSSQSSEDSSDDDEPLGLSKNKLSKMTLESAWDVRRRKRMECQKKSEKKCEKSSEVRLFSPAKEGKEEEVKEKVKQKRTSVGASAASGSGLARNKQGKKCSLENDKTQTTLTSWLKQKPKDDVTETIETEPAPVSSKGKKKKLFYDWNGEKLMIKSPIVVLKRTTNRKQLKNEIPKDKTIIDKLSDEISKIEEPPARNLRARKTTENAIGPTNVLKFYGVKSSPEKHIAHDKTGLHSSPKSLVLQTYSPAKNLRHRTKRCDQKTDVTPILGNSSTDISEKENKPTPGMEKEPHPLETSMSHLIVEESSKLGTFNFENKQPEMNTKAADNIARLKRFKPLIPLPDSPAKNLRKRCSKSDRDSEHNEGIDLGKGETEAQIVGKDEEMETQIKNSGKEFENKESLFWYFEGTRQLDVKTTKGMAESLTDSGCDNTSPNSQPADTDASLGLVENTKTYSPKRKSFTSQELLEDTLAQISKSIPGIDTELKSPEELCNTAVSLSPSYFTKFRKSCSRSESSETVLSNASSSELCWENDATCTQNVYSYQLAVKPSFIENGTIVSKCTTQDQGIQAVAFPPSRGNLEGVSNKAIARIRSSPRSKNLVPSQTVHNHVSDKLSMAEYYGVNNEHRQKRGSVTVEDFSDIVEMPSVINAGMA